MRMTLALVAVMLVGCATDQPAPRDESTESAACLEGQPATFCTPLGSSCDADASPFCARGLAWCSAGTCRSFCDGISYPHCASNELEQWSHAPDGGSVCVCLPAQ